MTFEQTKPEETEPRVWDDPQPVNWTEEEIAEIQWSARPSDTHE